MSFHKAPFGRQPIILPLSSRVNQGLNSLPSEVGRKPPLTSCAGGLGWLARTARNYGDRHIARKDLEDERGKYRVDIGGRASGGARYHSMGASTDFHCTSRVLGGRRRSESLRRAHFGQNGHSVRHHRNPWISRLWN